MQNVQRVQNVLHQISNVAAALLNLPKQLPAPLPQNHSCHQSDLQWRHHKVVNLPALEKKKNLTQLFRDGVTSLTPESRDIFSLHTAQTGTKVQEKWEKIKWVDLQTSQFHSSYLSLPPLPLTVYFFQAGVLFAQRAPNFGHFVTNLHTF